MGPSRDPCHIKNHFQEALHYPVTFFFYTHLSVQHWRQILGILVHDSKILYRFRKIKRFSPSLVTSNVYDNLLITKPTIILINLVTMIMNVPIFKIFSYLKRAFSMFQIILWQLIHLEYLLIWLFFVGVQMKCILSIYLSYLWPHILDIVSEPVPEPGHGAVLGVRHPRVGVLRRHVQDRRAERATHLRIRTISVKRALKYNVR